jgi:hypothetical protein
MLGRFHHESTSHHLRASMDQLIAIFCDIDDFCKAFEPVSYRHLLHMGQRQRTHQTTLALSEWYTVIVRPRLRWPSGAIPQCQCA